MIVPRPKNWSALSVTEIFRKLGRSKPVTAKIQDECDLTAYDTPNPSTRAIPSRKTLQTAHQS